MNTLKATRRSTWSEHAEINLLVDRMWSTWWCRQSALTPKGKTGYYQTFA